jgi:PPP family 3-phenylpropionic acid transporter
VNINTASLDVCTPSDMLGADYCPQPRRRKLNPGRRSRSWLLLPERALFGMLAVAGGSRWWARVRDIRIQFFLTLGMLGTVGPFGSVILRERGLTPGQVGYAFAIQNIVGVLSPIVMTMVADTKVDARRILAAMSAIAAVGLLGIIWARDLPQVLTIWTLYCIAQTAIFPLQDGVHFAQQRRAAQAAARLTPYHRVRVWGALGFMTPGVLLYLPLKLGIGLGLVLATGATFALLAAIHSLMLHDTRAMNAADAEESKTAVRLPTLAALRMLLEPRMLVFCAAIILVYMAFSVHWTYYAVYLTERVQLGKQWVGIANVVALCVEIPVTYACGWFLREIGVKRVLLLGMLLMALRMAMISLTTNPLVAVGTQVFHAFLILAVSVLPHTILDNRAGDRFRHSMQALFVVLVSCGNACANFGAGRLSARGYDLNVLFVLAAAVCVVAAGMILLMWKDDAADDGGRKSKGFDVIAGGEPKPALVEPPAQPI